MENNAHSPLSYYLKFIGEIRRKTVMKNTACILRIDSVIGQMQVQKDLTSSRVPRPERLS